MSTKSFFQSKFIIYIGLVFSIIILIILFLFYQECNEVKVNKVEVGFKSSNHNVELYDVTVIQDNSRTIKQHSTSIPGCHASLYIKTDSTKNYHQVNEMGYSLDSVWADADIEINSTLSTRYILSIKNGDSPKPTLDSNLVILIYPIETYESEDGYDHESKSKSKTYFRGDRKSWQNSARAFYSCNTYKTPHFFSQRNISIACIVLNINSRVYADSAIVNIDFKAPMNIMNIYPEPDERTSTGISYTSHDKIKKIEKEGAFVYAESILYKSMQDTRNYIIISLIGIFSSIFISLIAKLIFRKKEKSKDINTD